MKKIFSCLIILTGLLTAASAKAFCPVCTIAVGAGVGLAQWLGIDDTISGLWIGGLTVSVIAWTINWFNIKNIRFFGRKILTILFYYLIIVVPLFYTGIIGHQLNKLWGIDKLLLGIILGSITFLAGGLWYNYLKKKNGRAHFPFQKVAMPLAPLVILSFIFYFITR
jgi:hypothetical protein